MMRTAPRFWADPPGILADLLMPVAAAWQAAGRLQEQLSRPYCSPIPVICVGNLVAGGAGKTPVALALATDLAARGVAVHIVTRGYGGSLGGPVRVDPDRHDAAAVGDEALLLARRAPCWVARNRALAALEPRAQHYAGFNLLLSDADSLWYGSNRTTPFARSLTPGVYGLANESLDTPWPKLERVRAGFRTWLGEAPPAGAEGLFALLADRTPAEEPRAAHSSALPREWERALSAPFVLHPEYGTRCSTVLLLEDDGRLQLIERRFDPAGRLSGESEFRLEPGEWA